MSKLNCKPGDLAIVLPPKTVNWCPSTDKIVEVVRAIGAERFRTPDGIFIDGASGDGGNYWLVKFQRPELVVAVDGRIRTSFYTGMPDSRLRPIRDQPGEDETLTWAGLPKYRESHVAIEAVAREVLETFEGAAA